MQYALSLSGGALTRAPCSSLMNDLLSLIACSLLTYLSSATCQYISTHIWSQGLHVRLFRALARCVAVHSGKELYASEIATVAYL
jgi:hypothetical protein